MAMPDWQRPLADPSDLPLHRPSVGAMSVPSGRVDLWKPYVYRGTGEDVYEGAVTEHEVVVVKPKPKKIKPTKVKYPRQPRFTTTVRYHIYPALPDPPYAPGTHDLSHKIRMRGRRKPSQARAAAGWQPTQGADIDEWLEQYGG